MRETDRPALTAGMHRTKTETGRQRNRGRKTEVKRKKERVKEVEGRKESERKRIRDLV